MSCQNQSLKLLLYLTKIASSLLEGATGVIIFSLETFINTMLIMMNGWRWRLNWRHQGLLMWHSLWDNHYFLTALKSVAGYRSNKHSQFIKCAFRTTDFEMFCNFLRKIKQLLSAMFWRSQFLATCPVVFGIGRVNFCYNFYPQMALPALFLSTWVVPILSTVLCHLAC